MTRYVRISTPSRSASARASAFGRTLKPTTIAFDAEASMTSFSVIPPAAEWMTVTRTSVCSIFWSSESAASTEPATSRLEHDVEVLDAFLDALEEDVERDRLRALGELLPAQALATRLRVLARLALVLDHARVLAGRRRLVEADDLDRIAGAGVLELLAVEVVERANAPPGVARDDRVADVERAAVDEHRRHRPTADVEARLDDRP